MSTRTFRKLPGDDGYQFLVDLADFHEPGAHAGIEFTFRQLRREHHQLHSELEVECDFAPKEQRIPRDGKLIISCSDLNLSSQSARTQRAKYCAERSKTRPADGVDWVGIVDDACVRVIGAEREGEPVLALADVIPPEGELEYRVGGFVALRRDVVTLVADGGKGKSTFALYLLGRLYYDYGVLSLICDYETESYVPHQTLRQQFGEVPPGVFYRRCTLPFVEEADAIRREVHRLGISYCVLDSIVPACGDPAEESSTAAGLFRAQRAIGCGCLNIAHIAKSAERGKEKPFGSQFFWNESRSVWVLDSHATTDRLVLALHHRKNNYGPKHPSVGFELTYRDHRIQVHACNIADTAELADGLPLSRRVTEVVRQKPLPLIEIAERTGEKVNTVAQMVRRHTLLFTRVLGMDGIHRIGLVAKEPRP